MLDLDFSKLLILAVVTLIAIGPKELPKVLRESGRLFAKFRNMALSAQTQFFDAVNSAADEGSHSLTAVQRNLDETLGKSLLTSLDKPVLNETKWASKETDEQALSLQKTNVASTKISSTDKL